MRARSNCIFVQLSISGRIHHHPHYLHSAPRTKLCYSIIETRESRCLLGRLLCSLPHCILNAPASSIVDLHQTVGFFREEGMEAKHHEVNGINRVMACMRRKEERLAMCLRRVEVLQAQKAGGLAVAVPRKLSAPKSTPAKQG